MHTDLVLRACRREPPAVVGERRGSEVVEVARLARRPALFVGGDGAQCSAAAAAAAAAAGAATGCAEGLRASARRVQDSRGRKQPCGHLHRPCGAPPSSASTWGVRATEP